MHMSSKQEGKLSGNDNTTYVCSDMHNTIITCRP